MLIRFLFPKLCFDQSDAGGGNPAAPAAPAAPGAPAAPAVPEFSTLVPEEFKNEPWVKETKDLPSLFKRTKDLISEIGKRPGAIPQDNAKPEEWGKFNKAFGVPDTPEGYAFSPIPEGLETTPEFQKAMQQMLHKAGISLRQFKLIEPMWNSFALEMAKNTQAGAQALEKDFDKLAVATFGERKDKALANAKAMIDKFTPEGLKGHLGQLSNENLIIMAGVLDGIIQKYVSEDQIPSGGGNAGEGPQGEQAIRDAAQKLMLSEEYKNPFHPKHKETVDKVTALYNRLPK